MKSRELEALYALRNGIERFFNRAKNSRRVATRYDKLIESAVRDLPTSGSDQTRNKIRNLWMPPLPC